MLDRSTTCRESGTKVGQLFQSGYKVFSVWRSGGFGASHPGTKLHQRLNIQGRPIGRTTGNNLDGTTNFIPRMNRETLHKFYRNLMGQHGGELNP